jgi:glucosamine-6-phosphate deaminase
MKFITTDSYKELSHIAANIMGAQITLKPNSVIGLATGSTPLGLYRELGERCQKGDLDFSEVITVNLDEYAGLKGDHEQSYRYFMQKNLFDHINVKPENTYVPNGCSADPAQEGKEYIIARIETDDEELDAFLFSLGCYSGEPITVVSRRKRNCTVSIKDGRYCIDNQLAAAICISE